MRTLISNPVPKRDCINFIFPAWFHTSIATTMKRKKYHLTGLGGVHAHRTGYSHKLQSQSRWRTTWSFEPHNNPLPDQRMCKHAAQEIHTRKFTRKINKYACCQITAVRRESTKPKRAPMEHHMRICAISIAWCYSAYSKWIRNRMMLFGVF